MQQASLNAPRYAALETSELSAWEIAASSSPPWNELYGCTPAVEAVWGLAQACLEDLGGAWMQRDPSESETWQSLSGSDRRLLTQLDGVLGVGTDLIARLAEQQLELQAPDEWFAHVFVLANIDCPEAEALLLKGLGSWPEEDWAVAHACAEALAVSAHPQLARIATSLAPTSPGSGLVVPAPLAVAYHALALRNELPEENALAVLTVPSHPLGLVAAATALRHRLSQVRSSQPAQVERALHYLQHQPQEAVVRAGLLTGGVARDDGSFRLAVELCESEGPGYASSALAAVLHGAERTTEWLQSLWAAEPSAELAEVMARQGDPALVPFLIAQLEAEVEPEACAAALGALTGARPLEERLVNVYEQEERAFTGDPDARVSVTELTLKPDQWHDYWAGAEATLTQHARVRFGQPYGAAVLATQLQSGSGGFETREYTYLELQTLAAGQAPWIWVGDLYWRQAACFESLKQWVQTQGVQLAANRWTRT